MSTNLRTEGSPKASNRMARMINSFGNHLPGQQDGARKEAWTHPAV
jgi:hypothetical protein